MITTCRKHVPFGWIIIACLPVIAIRYSEAVSGGSFVFTMKKFIENPALLTLILSIPSVLSFVFSPLISFMSDRVWTRFGRRMPFLVVSWIGMAACFILMPLMPNIWMVAVVYIVFDLFKSMYAPFEPLRNEIVPPHQRLRSATYMEWLASITQTLFWFVIFGRFDDVTFVSGFPLTGEEGMYWAGAVLLVCITLAMIIGVRETEPVGDSRGERLNLRNLVKGLADRDLWPVYTLVFSSALLSAGLGPLGVLVYTETFGFTKQDQGTNVVVGGLINMCIIGFLGWWAQRMERIRAYQLLLGFSLVLKMAYYLYIEFVLPDQRATVVEAIMFGEVLSIVMLLKNMIYYPLAYDYVIRNKMGTFQAGSEMIKRLTSIVTVNMVGLFVTFYSMLFMAPPGEMTRVTLREPVAEQAMAAVMASHAWSDGHGPAMDASRIDVRPFRASGFVGDTNRAWEIRLLNPQAKTLAGERERLSAEERALQTDSDPAAVIRLQEVKARIAAVDADLKVRAMVFSQQVRSVLGDRLMAEGDGIRTATVRPARLLSIPVRRHVPVARQEAILDELRRGDAVVVDLRLESGEGGRHFVLGVLADGADDQIWRDRLAAVANRYVPGSVEEGGGMRSVATRAIVLDLATIEEPLEDRPSPITWMVNGVLSWFGADPRPERRVNAVGRNLRQIDTTPQVSVRRSSGPDRSLVITALLSPIVSPAPVPTADAVEWRLLALLGGDAVHAAEARQLYERTIPAAAAMRITIARPFIAADYAPMKYDYMSGYLMMFVLGLIGLWITIEFCRRERKGLIRKLGLDEEKELK